MIGGGTLSLLLGTAVGIAALHTAVGVDHTLPFIALGRAQNWTLRKVLVVTALLKSAQLPLPVYRHRVSSSSRSNSRTASQISARSAPAAPSANAT